MDFSGLLIFELWNSFHLTQHNALVPFLFICILFFFLCPMLTSGIILKSFHIFRPLGMQSAWNGDGIRCFLNGMKWKWGHLSGHPCDCFSFQPTRCCGVVGTELNVHQKQYISTQPDQLWSKANHYHSHTLRILEFRRQPSAHACWF